ncbi:MAG: PDGLE domain-containing protein [Candidatus Margulisbacteria bacterium]|nr:PDGLE domain-containing protein [Candidatus Margulisiibacteriota bacterium]
MKKIFWLAVVISIAAAFFASTHPDGLDFAAAELSFAEKGQDRTAPMPDYSLQFLPKGSVSTSLAGVAGILITLAIFWLAVYILKEGSKKMVKSKVFLFLVCVFYILYFSFNFSPAFAARPLVTDDFYTVAQGGYELEMGYASTQNQASLANVTTLSFKRGFLPNFDLGIEVPYTSSSPAGFNDILLHAKYRLFEQNGDEGMTARVDFKFDNGNLSQGLGSGDNDYCLMLIYSKMIGQTKVHLNFGHVNVGINAGIQSDDYIAYTAALEYPAWGEKGDIVAEYAANNANFSPNPAFVQFGARYCLASTFKIDAGYSFGLNNLTLRNSLTAGIHWEF